MYIFYSMGGFPLTFLARPFPKISAPPPPISAPKKISNQKKLGPKKVRPLYNYERGGNKIFAKLSKCRFAQAKVDFLWAGS